MIRLAIVLSVVLTTPLHAQHQHQGSQPVETGQSAFAAMAEIVDLLRTNPHTDWQQVDIAGLRSHLVDMDRLMMETAVEMEVLPTSVVFNISGDDRTVEAIHRMVPAHAPFLDAETGWETTVEVSQDGAELVVSGDIQMIAALGFYGLMAIGAHHQEHHLSIASGERPHQ